MNHREVGLHTMTFASALRGALREDPNIILVGEMRDLETISLAVEAAATGHLVFGTLHTENAAKTVDRIVEVFPHGEQPQIRNTLSTALRVVVAQNLFKRIDQERTLCGAGNFSLYARCQESYSRRQDGPNCIGHADGKSHGDADLGRCDSGSSDEEVDLARGSL